MSTRLQIGELEVEVIRKDIKNVHLSVLPPVGKVRLSAPEHVKIDTLRVYVVSRLQWIRKQQEKLKGQDRETPRDYVERESHYLWGKRYLLTIDEKDEPPKVELTHRQMILQVRPGATQAKREEVLASWYRDRLREAVPPLIARWEPMLGVKVKRFFIQHMKTKWGGCSPERGTVRLNSELAKKPPECLEYLVVHEMVHLLEPTHNDRFLGLMDRFMPNWRSRRATLNSLPVRHETWGY
ncbi:M48 family metallopeptidase [Haloferula sp. A504]|uniref:M48 family metallopeptidase n=1 Tax=Haloferula sp. A504 TaxID=3373601 RepID=UPI0031C1E808|nr:M48 family metallopeptidase [Verrucomicrobiaceae bacterium E54]